jgi:hypothetical protein
MTAVSLPEPFDLLRLMESVEAEHLAEHRRRLERLLDGEPVGFGEREPEPPTLESEGERLMRLVRECAVS